MNLLLNSHPLIIIPELTVVIGLNEAIVLQQIHYWLEKNKVANKNFKEERYWTYNSISSWRKQFPFWCENTISATFNSLEKQNLIITGNFNKFKGDRTKWYSINYNELQKLIDESIPQKAGYLHFQKNRKPIPDATTETKKQNIHTPPAKNNPDDKSHDESVYLFKNCKVQNKSIENLIKRSLQKYDIDRIKNNIEYANKYATKDYRNYLSLAIANDYAQDEIDKLAAIEQKKQLEIENGKRLQEIELKNKIEAEKQKELANKELARIEDENKKIDEYLKSLKNEDLQRFETEFKNDEFYKPLIMFLKGEALKSFYYDFLRNKIPLDAWKHNFVGQGLMSENS